MLDRILRSILLSRPFNAHLRHAFVTGPSRSWFWPSLELRRKRFKKVVEELNPIHECWHFSSHGQHQDKLPSVAVWMQEYRILRAATYQKFRERTVREQLEAAIEFVMERADDSFANPNWKRDRNEIETAAMRLFVIATSKAAENLRSGFQHLFDQRVDDPAAYEVSHYTPGHLLAP